MRKLLLSIFLFCPALLLQAQTLTSAKFRISDRVNGFRSIELVLDNHLLIVIDEEGQIEIEYFIKFDQAADFGRLKSITGNTLLVSVIGKRYVKDNFTNDPNRNRRSLRKD